MPIESKRELIMQNLENTLGEIDGLDPYWTNVTSVSRMPIVPPTLPLEDKPGVIICTSGSNETILHCYSYHDRREMTLTIAGILDKVSHRAIRAINRFMQDVTLAVLKDPTRGNNATDTCITSRRETTDPKSGVSCFEIALRIQYECDRRRE